MVNGFASLARTEARRRRSKRISEEKRLIKEKAQKL
jgi:hypothetical protein